MRIEYLQLFVPLLRERDRANSDTAIKDKELTSIAESIKSMADQDNAQIQFKALIERRMQIAAEKNRISKQIRELNSTFLKRFMEQLQLPQSEDLYRRYKAASYPKSYPDLQSAERVLDFIVNIKSLTEQQKETSKSILDTYQSTYKRICEDAESEETRWQELISQNGELPEFESPSIHKARLLLILGQRKEANLKVINKVYELLSPEQLAELPPVVEIQHK